MWNRLKPRYKLLATLPCIGGGGALALTIFPGAWLLADLMDIPFEGAVNQNRHGALFMLIFCSCLPVALVAGVAVTRRLLAWWLVDFARYSPDEARLVVTWCAYPQAWFATRTPH